MAVTGEGNNGDPEGGLPTGSGGDSGADPGEPAPAKLRRVEGPIEVLASQPPVQLLREYKGLTVADLLRDEIVDRLPGQVRTAMHHIRAGDFEAAERALPGDFAPVLCGPGAERRSSRSFVIWVLVTASLLAAALASYWF